MLVSWKNKVYLKYILFFFLWLSEHWSNEPPECRMAPRIPYWKKLGWNLVLSRERLASQQEVLCSSDSFSDHLVWEVGTETMLVGKTTPQPGRLSNVCLLPSNWMESGLWRWIWEVQFSTWHNLESPGKGLDEGLSSVPILDWLVGMSLDGPCLN